MASQPGRHCLCPGFRRYTPPWEAKARETAARSLSLSLSLSASAGGAAAGIFPQAFSAISGPSSSQPGPESERGLIGRKLKPSQTNTEVRFLFN